jgi:hypothetical protein
MLVRRRPERNAISADNSSEVNRRARIGARRAANVSAGFLFASY